jgi:hypothetical protein
MMDKIKAEMEINKAKADANLKEIKEEMKTTQAEMKADREVMLARIEVSQEREDTNLKEMKEQILANQAKTDTTQERMNANLRKEMKSTVNAFQERMDASIADMKDGRKERTACQEAAEANPEKLETNPEMMQSVGEHREVPKEEAAVRSSGALKKWHRGRHLASGRRREPKERTRGNCGSRSKLAAARRRMSCRAWVTRSQGTRQGQCGTNPESTDAQEEITDAPGRQQGRKDPGDRRPLYLRKERTTANGIRGWSSGQ